VVEFSSIGKGRKKELLQKQQLFMMQSINAGHGKHAAGIEPHICLLYSELAAGRDPHNKKNFKRLFLWLTYYGWLYEPRLSRSIVHFLSSIQCVNNNIMHVCMIPM
jgi:hypothetical protein